MKQREFEGKKSEGGKQRVKRFEGNNVRRSLCFYFSLFPYIQGRNNFPRCFIKTENKKTLILSFFFVFPYYSLQKDVCCTEYGKLEEDIEGVDCVQSTIQ